MQGIENILVSVSGDKVDDTIVRLACTLAKKWKSKLYIVHVIEVERALPLDAEVEPETRKGEDLLREAQKVAQEQDCKAYTELLQAREAGPALVEGAVQREADLIMMGLPYKRRFGEFTIGNATSYVFKNAPCRVIVYREPIP